MQTPFYHNDRKYWKLTAKYQNQGLEVYDRGYAVNVSRPHLLATLHWTEKGIKFLKRLLAERDHWQLVLTEHKVSALHLYINKAGRQVVQLTRYNPVEPLDGTRAYIPERIRKEFVQDARSSQYYASKMRWDPFGAKCAIDDRDSELLADWITFITEYNHWYSVLINSEDKK